MLLHLKLMTMLVHVMLAYFTIVKVLFEKNGDVIKSNQMLDFTFKMLIKCLTIFVVQFWTEEYKLLLKCEVFLVCSITFCFSSLLQVHPNHLVAVSLRFNG